MDRPFVDGGGSNLGEREPDAATRRLWQWVWMRTLVFLLIVPALFFGLLQLDEEEPAKLPRAARIEPRATSARPPLAEPVSPRALGPIAFDEGQRRYVAPWGGAEAQLTLHPDVQARVEEELRAGRPFFGATVVLEAKTGRVLALAEHSQRAPEKTGVALRADAPAASIFKLVSAAALLDHGVAPNEQICFSGGKRRLLPKHLEDRRRDRCVPFADVIPLSLNAAMAKLTDKHLEEGALVEMASRLGFDRPLPFEVEVEPSRAHIPADRFGRANTAAGFGDVRLSTLHAAMLTSIIANRGMLVPPRLVASVDGGALPPLEPPQQVLDPSVAEALSAMMAETVTRGTARRTFHKRKKGSPLEGVRVAAKTGSLLFYDQHVDHSWLVAFAPVEDPEVVVASVVVNDWQLWYTKAGPLAKSALEAGLAALAAKDAPRSPTPVGHDGR